MQKDFDSWSKYKKKINSTSDDNIAYFYERELWWCALGINIGFEQDGKNKHHERPVLILRKFNRYFVIYC